MYVKPPTGDDASTSSWAVRFAAKGAAAGAIMFASGLWFQRTPSASQLLRVAGKGLEYFGFRFLVVAIGYGIAGGAALLMPNLEQRKSIAIFVLMVACLGFLFVPICWNSKSDDCRSIVTRVSDAAASSLGGTRAAPN